MVLALQPITVLGVTITVKLIYGEFYIIIIQNTEGETYKTFWFS